MKNNETHIIYILYILLCFIVACHSPNNHKPQLPAPERDTTQHKCMPIRDIRDKGALNIAILYNTTDYYIYQGFTKGFHYELVDAFAKDMGLNLKLSNINNTLDSVFIGLNDGSIDIATMSLSKGEERMDSVLFSETLFKTDVVLVQNKKNKIDSLTQLNGKSIFIIDGISSEHFLLKLQDSLGIKFQIVKLSAPATYEDLVDCVNNGKIDFTIIDKNIVKVLGRYMLNIDYSITIEEGEDIAWGVTSHNNKFRDTLNQWLSNHQSLINTLKTRYFDKPIHGGESINKYNLLGNHSISSFDKIFKREGKRIGWDWRLLAAIAYEESSFDTQAVSQYGAYGLMQILPETANRFGVYDFANPDSNVIAAVSYLKYLDKLFSKYDIDDINREKFVIASYNAGAGHILDAMELSKKYGRSPNIWDNNVDFFILNKSNPKYYNDPIVKSGYCDGTQTFKYVNKVFTTYAHYCNILP